MQKRILRKRERNRIHNKFIIPPCRNMTLNRESNKIFITETQTLTRFILSIFSG